jgi:hypothetical protein
MAKKQTILDEIGQMAPPPDGGSSWYRVMEKERPDDYAQLVEVIRDYYRGGHTAQVFPSLARLHRYLSGDDPRAKRTPLISVGVSSFVSFAGRVQDGSIEA